MEKRGNLRNSAEKKQRHRNEFISVWKSCGNPVEKRGKTWKSCTLTFLLLYVDKFNWKHKHEKWPPTKIQVIFETSGGA